MNDHDFLHAFEHGKLHEFPHRSHVRMAWLYLRCDGWTEGSKQIVAGIRHLALAHGAPRKYHETITLFWAAIVYSAIQQNTAEDDFERFLEQNPHLLNVKLINEFYSPALLWSDNARQIWTAPDLKPMPHQVSPG